MSEIEKARITEDSSHPMRVTLKRTWELIDSQSRRCVEVSPGTYAVEKIPNPFGHPGFWFVLAGTRVGMACGAWTQWINGAMNRYGNPIDWGDFAVVIYVDGRKVLPPLEDPTSPALTLIPYPASRCAFKTHPLTW